MRNDNRTLEDEDSSFIMSDIVPVFLLIFFVAIFAYILYDIHQGGVRVEEGRRERAEELQKLKYRIHELEDENKTLRSLMRQSKTGG